MNGFQTGPEWDSFSALEFHALDRPTFIYFFGLAFSVPPLRFLLSTYTYYLFARIIYFFEQGAAVRGVIR